MPPIITPPCPVCAKELKVLTRGKDRYTYYRCPECRHVTCAPLPTPEELNAFYDGFLFAMPAANEVEEQTQAINGCVENIIQDCGKIAGLKPPYKVLDWGGGLGFYANGFALQGCECTLIDIDAQACAYASEHFPGRFQVIADDPVTHRFNETFDLIFCSHVIEHCTDLSALLKSMTEALTPTGVIIFATPNQQCKEFYFRPGWMAYYLKHGVRSAADLPAALWRFLRNPWICLDPPRHVHAFNRSSISTLLQQHGFNTLTAFSEYSTDQHYQLHRADAHQARSRPKRLVQKAFRSASALGIGMLRAMHPKGAWGNNLVAFGKREPPA